MKQNTGNPSLVPGTPVPFLTLVRFTVPVEVERADAEALREEYAHTDPTTGRVLWTVDSYDLEAYDALLEAETFAGSDLAPYFLATQEDVLPVGSAYRLGLFAAHEVREAARGAA